MSEFCPPAEVNDPERLAALQATGLLDSGPEESFERLGALARRLIGAPTALVSLIDHDRQHFKCCLGLTEPYLSRGETPLTHSICQYALAGDQPLVIPDATADSRLIGNQAVEELKARAYLGIPLVGRTGHVLGSFCVLDHEPRSWTDDEVSVMSDLAQSVMAEIELREVAAEREAYAADLASSEARLRAIMDGLFIFAGVLDTAGTMLDANKQALDAAGLELDDVVGLPFWDTYWWSWDSATQAQLQAAVQRAAAGQTCRYDVTVRLSEDRFITIDFQLAPLVEDGQIVRLIPSGLDITERKRFEEELARLAAAESGHRRQAEDLLELSRALGSAVDMDEIAGIIAEVGSVVVGAAFSNIAVVTDDGRELELRHGAVLDSEISARWPRVPLDPDTPLGAAIVTGEAQYAESAERIRVAFPIGADDSEAAGFETLAAVPVAGGVAAIGFAWTEPTSLDAQLASTLDIVAELTGQAMERAAVHERDRRIADQLQQSLLPERLPEIPGAELASRYEAGGAGLDVGGDWFDVGLLGAGRWVIAVGDVVGRGLDAASKMGHLRSAFTTLATTSVELEALLDRLDTVADAAGDGFFSTMVVVEYTPTTGAIRALSAGHPPPFIRRRSGEVVRLDGSGRPLGIEQGRDRCVIADVLGPGDCLFVYTDGLIERRTESIDVGLERLAAELARAEASSAGAVCDSILERLRTDSTDDIAVLSLLVADSTSGT